MDGGSFISKQAVGSASPTKFKRRYLHMLYRETLADYRDPTSDWMQNFTRQTLMNIWDSYRETRKPQ